MSNPTSAVHHVSPTPPNITAVVLNEDLTHCRKLLHLLQQCYGPRGKKHSIGGADGSPVRAFTSLASRLTNQLRIKNPFNSLIVGGVKTQADRRADGGCLLALLTLELTLLWRSEEAGNGVRSVNDSIADRTCFATALAADILEIIFEKLESFSQKHLVFRLEMTSFKDLTVIVRSVLTSNSIFYNAHDAQVDHVVGLVLRIFIASIHGGGGGENGSAVFRMPLVEYRHVYGLDMVESDLKEGVIIPAPTDWRGKDRIVQVYSC